MEAVPRSRRRDRPYSLTQTIGTNPADSFTAVLMAHRDPTTMAWSAEPPLAAAAEIVIPVDMPPWWRMRKKHAMFYTRAGRGDHARIMMAASLLCSDTVDEAHAIDEAFVDVRAWIEKHDAAEVAVRDRHEPRDAGQDGVRSNVLEVPRHLRRRRQYPNQLVPLADVGTDPMLAHGETEFAAASSSGSRLVLGRDSRLEPQTGYIAPPLDGIWATAPFFHNGSVPTLEGVLDPTKRPKYWTRTFESTDYDPATVGWKFTALDHGEAGEPTERARRSTTRPCSATATADTRSATSSPPTSAPRCSST